jgi:DNA polymerase III subunit gamma/tau
MSYTVLARRYRSETFDDVVGQEAVSQTLKNAIEGDRVAHAYLFNGTRGVGKTSMARILAKALNCLAFDKPTAKPCCKCESCIAVNEGNDIDVIEIDGASNTGVDHIRELRQNAIYRPARGRFKIYIIDEVHMLSTGAFNALLKTLEEPPEHVKFIMATTEPNKVLPTILSRCQRFDFRNIQASDIADHLKKILTDEKMEAEDSLLRRIARLARGSMRDALSLLDQLLSMSDGKLTLELLDELLGTPRSELIIGLVEAIGQNNLSAALIQVDKALQEGLALEQLAQALQGHFRDLMILRNCPDDTELVDLSDKAIRDKMTEQAKMFDDAALVYNITVMEELLRAVKASGSGRPLFEAAIVRMTVSERFSDTKALIEQLQQLQSAPVSPSRGNPVTQSQSAPRPAAPIKSEKTAWGKAPPYKAESKPVEPSSATGTKKVSDPFNSKKQFTPPETLDIGFLQQQWQNILGEIENRGKKSLVAFVQLAQPLSWGEQTLTIQFRPEQNGMRSLLQDRPEQMREIGEVLANVLAQPIQLCLASPGAADTNKSEKTPPGKTEPEPAARVNGGHGPPYADKPEPAIMPQAKPEPKASSAKMPPGAKPSQNEINEAMKEPQIRNVQEILGGKVRHIERGKS